MLSPLFTLQSLRSLPISRSLQSLALIGLLLAPQAWIGTPIALADQEVCATPGADGPAPSTGQVNTAYAGAGSGAAKGTDTISLGNSAGSGTQIKKGDLLMIIQMQGADIDFSNTAAYGDGSSANNPNIGIADYPASGVANGNVATNFTAGDFEYAVAASNVPLAGGTLMLTKPLINTYVNADPTTTADQGQKRFQVVRVPQYSTATISTTLTAAPWDGSKGGVFAMDVAGAITFTTGGGIDMNGKGFRGGGGRQLSGDTATPGLFPTDLVTLSSRLANGSKGEGTAGTPKYLVATSLATTLGLTTATPTTLITGSQEGYPNGSYGRGAPGNAGGGGTDGYPQHTSPKSSQPYLNGHNAGGGGGSNGGLGGKGGKTWFTAFPYGGDGGTPFPASARRLIMGGGGGAGSTNDGTGGSSGLASSGAPGGGLIMVRASSISGPGLISANGAKPGGQPANDASGGGGAGGSILVVTDSGRTTGLTLRANGGDGGTNTGGGSPHGPGGGGSGGIILNSQINGNATVSVDPGKPGYTNNDTTNFGGATAGTGATGAVETKPTDAVTMISGAHCLLETKKSTTTPGPLQAPAVATYTVTVSNKTGTAQGINALNVVIKDSGLPTGFTHTPVPVTPVYLGGAAGPATVTATGTTTAPQWEGTTLLPFTIPPGGRISITFNANIAAGTTIGTYNNSATVDANYSPIAITSGPTSPTVTVTYDGTISTNTGEDVKVVASSPLDVKKSAALVEDKDGSGNLVATPGDVLEYTIVTTNPSTSTVNGVTLTDPIPTTLTYFPGSLKITTGPNVGSKTDGATDDQAEIAGTQILARLGTGATGAVAGSLAPNTSTTLTFRATIKDPTGSNLVSNQATVIDGNGSVRPSDDPSTTTTFGDPTNTKVGPRLRLVKRITGIKKFGAAMTPIGVYNDLGGPLGVLPEELTDSPPVAWPGGLNGARTYLLGAINSSQVSAIPGLPGPKDEVEYTIYFLADGPSDALGVKLCDFIPANQTFVSGSITKMLGTIVTSIADAPSTAGGFYANGSQPTVCPPTNNNGNGAVYLNIGDVPATLTVSTPVGSSSAGYLRFRATVK
jgi:uncharacterized repeat protein (TIGR01451 family)